ncbi:FG-GAP-like repeat-containing protein [Terricaulis sp.]|uniref:FG-GAP-like repeat-containing protein n=1 Tax=Terricaulis sp. TaxID=2768686 RepID=UPI003782E1A3
MRNWDLLIGGGGTLGQAFGGFQSLHEKAESSGSAPIYDIFDRIGDDSGIARLNPPVVQEISEPTDQISGDIFTIHSLTLGQTETGVVNFAGDRDYFRINLVAGQSYVFTLTGEGVDPLDDCYLELYNSNGLTLAFDDDGGPGTDSMLRFTATTTGIYYINARAWEPEGGPSASIVGGYTITFNTGPAQNPIDTINLGPTQTGPNIAVYFATAGQTWNGDLAARNWTQSEMDAAMAALQTYANVSNLTFSITTNSAAAQFILTLDTDIGANVLGHMGTSGGVGYAAFNPNGSGWSTNGLQPGGGGFVTLIHEFGHGLGLAHPHDNGGVSEVMQGVLQPFASYGTFNLNQGVFTTMSYNDGWDLNPVGVNVSSSSGSQSTPGALDVALIQQRYGVNTNFNNGNSFYTLVAATTRYTAIWDTGGIDTISFSGTQAAVIDLRAATLLNEIGGGGFVSYVTGFHMGFTIDAGVVIENGTGGDGADTITGNSANNVLTGNGGVDTITGGAGNDTIVGGVGNDLINGGAGFDTATYAVASSGATWTHNTIGTWSIVAGSEGNENITSIELLHFNDRDVHLDTTERTFSGDGTSDVLFRRNDGIMASWEVTGTTVNGASFLPAAGAEWTPLSTGDFNGDGRDDVLWRRNDGLIYSWEMNGGAVSSVHALAGIGNEWSFLGIGDFNADGEDDMAWQRNDGVVYAWQMNGGGITSANVVASLGAEWTMSGIGDFNSDGRDDFLWRNDDGSMVMWFMNGTTISSSGFTSAQVDNTWNVVGVGDVNLDGRDDIFLRHDGDGAVAVWMMNGTTVSSSGTIASVDPATWFIENIGDYNGDGRDDILWRNTDGVVYTWLLNGTSIVGSGGLSGVGAEWDIVGGG